MVFLKKTEMINLAKNNRNLPKPSLVDHCVPETVSCRHTYLIG